MGGERGTADNEGPGVHARDYKAGLCPPLIR